MTDRLAFTLPLPAFPLLLASDDDDDGEAAKPANGFGASIGSTPCPKREPPAEAGAADGAADGVGGIARTHVRRTAAARTTTRRTGRSTRTYGARSASAIADHSASLTDTSGAPVVPFVAAGASEA